ncbi:putative N-acetylmannosaminyltransferase [Phycisphaerae bacterium RAS1]|nr:putative N-acetylmannosaminyltransferase [Phycisphaerae bacterium RAS1]
MTTQKAAELAPSAARAARRGGYAYVGGVRIDAVDMRGALEHIERLVSAGRSAYVVTPNVDHIIRAQTDPHYAQIVRGADLVLADGQPLVWASKLRGTPLPGRVAGSDLFPLLCQRAAARGWRVFFMGGAPGAADSAKDVLTKRHPGLDVCGTYCPPMGFEQDARELRKAIEAVRAAGAQIVLVGLGSPKQERWIVEHQAEYGPAVSIGIGVSFSFVAGDVRRAPRWMQRCGLEWLHRLLQEPGRLWKRYLVNGWRFLPILLRDLMGRSNPRA